ncbi:MAG: porin [Gammaproteobacteria bacterium]|nr:porin [Gammaproteobacteria bacterium]MBU1969971.1 porin [Gammaproteobacteria bacterium]
MNKKLIAIAVAAALAPAAAMADITVYGRVHASLDSTSGVASNTNNLALNDNSSRFGVKGSEALDGGLSALFQLETGVSYSGTATTFANGNRDSYIGLTGGFGTFLAGRLPAANQFVYDSNLFGDQLGDAANFTNVGTPGRATSALHYVAPAFGPVTVALTVLTASAMSDNGLAPGKTSPGIKVSYADNGVTASLTTFSLSNGAASETKMAPLSLAGSYDFGMGKVSAQYVKAKTTVGGADANTTKVINVGASFKVSDNDTAKVQISKASESLSAASDGATMLAVGFDHALSKKTGVYVVYAKVSNDAAGTYTMDNWGHQSRLTVAAGEDPSGFGVGLTHNF